MELFFLGLFELVLRFQVAQEMENRGKEPVSVAAETFCSKTIPWRLSIIHKAFCKPVSLHDEMKCPGCGWLTEHFVLENNSLQRIGAPNTLSSHLQGKDKTLN